MIVKKLVFSSFRNLQKTDLSPGERFNVFHGNNGQGKTNILEAIYVLGTMKSFRHAKNRDLIRWQEPFSLLKGIVEKNGVTREITLLIEKEGKKARVDRKALERLSDFFGCLNVVVFSPEELTMVKGTPELRRRYLDRAVFGAEPDYLSAHHDYARILKNRNALLKSGVRDGLDIWSDKLIETGSRVVMNRLLWLQGIRELFQQFHGEIAGQESSVELIYRSVPGTVVKDGEEYGQQLRKSLVRLADEEYRRGTTQAGPHRDDLEFMLDGRSVKQFASQGEQRSFILALKMAEIEYLHRLHGNPPVLLLDDMTSELDGQRNRNLLRFLEEKQMQVFITTTTPDNLNVGNRDNYRMFSVEEGNIIH
jgi:DNA replication and repair protein RecF